MGINIWLLNVGVSGMAAEWEVTPSLGIIGAIPHSLQWEESFFYRLDICSNVKHGVIAPTLFLIVFYLSLRTSRFDKQVLSLAILDNPGNMNKVSFTNRIVSHWKETYILSTGRISKILP